jgi:hypothetical protein
MKVSRAEPLLQEAAGVEAEDLARDSIMAGISCQAAMSNQPLHPPQYPTAWQLQSLVLAGHDHHVNLSRSVSEDQHTQASSLQSVEDARECQ